VTTPETDDDAVTPSDGTDVLGERQERGGTPSTQSAEPTAADPDAAPATTNSAGSRWILVLFVTALLAAAGGVAIWRRGHA